MTEYWQAVLARLGTRTGDGRILAPGGITNRDLPMPLMWQEKTAPGHDGAVTVGAIESISYSSDTVTAAGSFLDEFPDRERVFELIRKGIVGPSVDLADNIEYQMDDDGGVLITQAGIGGVTLVPIEAFSDVSIHMTSGDTMALVAAVRSSGWGDMPIADAARAWDSGSARQRVDSWSDGDMSKYARAFLYKDDASDSENKTAYGFQIADVIDGNLTIVPRAVFAAAGVLQGSRGGTKAPAEDQASMKRVLSGIYKRLDRPAPWDDSMQASASVTLPPLSWFTNPNFEEVTPITITDDGRVFGHIAPWGTCHVGLPGCVTAPSSPSEYAYFLTGSETTAEGVEVPVGKLTIGGGHADPESGFRAAAEHYDDAGTAVASVFAGEDEYGIWVSGYVIPGTSHDSVKALQRSPISGDWRRIGGNLELIAAHAVNVPGFPIPRARVKFSSGHQISLISSFSMPAPKVEEKTEKSVDTSAADEARVRWAWNNRKGR
jgi:hypothetical protein